MKLYGTVTDISEKTPLENVKLRFSVDETVLMTVFTDGRGVFEAEQDLSDYVGRQLKVKVQKENFEDKAVAYEIGQEDIEINIELTAVKPVEKQPDIPAPSPTPKSNKNLLIIGGVACAVIVAVIVFFMIPPKPEPKPKIVFFKAEPSTIDKGNSATLSWKTQNADQIVISNIGKVDSSGSKSVSPNQTTTYKLTVKNKSGKLFETCTIVIRDSGDRQPAASVNTIRCDIIVDQYEGGTLKHFDGTMTFIRKGRKIESGKMEIRFQGGTLHAKIISGTLDSRKFKIEYVNQNQENRVLKADGNVQGDLRQRFKITNGKYGLRNLDWRARCRSN